jgi:hypothetical protein
VIAEVVQNSMERQLWWPLAARPLAIYTKFQRASCSTGAFYKWCDFESIERCKVVTIPLLDASRILRFHLPHNSLRLLVAKVQSSVIYTNWRDKMFEQKSNYLFFVFISVLFFEITSSFLSVCHNTIIRDQRQCDHNKIYKHKLMSSSSIIIIII